MVGFILSMWDWVDCFRGSNGCRLANKERFVMVFQGATNPGLELWIPGIIIALRFARFLAEHAHIATGTG